MEENAPRVGGPLLGLTLVLLGLTLAGWGQEPCPWQELDLAAAQRSDQIGVRIVGSDNFHGDAIRVTVTASAASSIRITVKPGTVLESTVPDEQDMVVLGVRGKLDEALYIERSDHIEVGCGETATYVLEAYCLELEKDAPASSTEFRVGGPAPEPVLAVVEASPPPGSDISFAIQQAVWVATDDLTSAEMAPDDAVTMQILVDAGLVEAGEIAEIVEGENMLTVRVIVAVSLLLLGVVALLIL